MILAPFVDASNNLTCYVVNCTVCINYPDYKVHGANMGPIWGRQDPGGPYVGPMNFAIWVVTQSKVRHRSSDSTDSYGDEIVL